MSHQVWFHLTAEENIPPREGRAAIVSGRELAIFNLGDRFLAVDGRCPHKSGPLCDGIVAGQSVVCPLHAWKVNLESGAVERPAGSAECVRTYATRVEAGIVLVALEDTDEQVAPPLSAASRGGSPSIGPPAL